MTEKIITLAFLVFSGIYLFTANHLSFGTLSVPKSGFLPILAGGTAVTLSLLILIRQFKVKTPKINIDWTKFVFLLLGLLFYIVFLSVVGYFIATCLFLLYLFKVADADNWLIPIALAITSSAVLYLLFQQFLGVTLP